MDVETLEQSQVPEELYWVLSEQGTFDCPKCGGSFTEPTKFCPDCGVRLVLSVHEDT